MKNLNFKISNLKNYLSNNKEVLIFLLFSFVLYLFFYKNIFSNQFNFWNSDAMIKMFPVRVFLYEKLSNGEFPFWTERVFLGYSLYQDIENGALNPINLISIILFGPVLSLKILHLLTFMIGSLCIYLIIKRIYPHSKIVGSLISVLVYYFSFFQINHLIHMNIVLVSMLFPIHMYLVQRYLDSKNRRYLIFQVLFFSYGILWGQPQITFFNLAGTFLFFYFWSGEWKKSVKYIFLILFFTLSLTLFQLIPSYNAFKSSPRLGEIVKYTEFTNSPTVLLNNIFPFSLGYYQNFVGYQISGAFSFVETYNYLSVIGFILLILYIIYGSKDKFYNFVVFTTYFYIIFTFLGNFFGTNLPVYSSFRYWTRGVFIISFLLIFCINFFISTKKETLKRNLNHISYIFLILILTYFFESKDFQNFLVEKRFVYLKKIDILIWFSFIVFSVLSFYFYLKNKINSFVFSLIIFVLILSDLKYFSSDFLPLRISRYRSEQNYKTDSDCLNKRCLLENQKYNGYEFLLFKTYSPFGYSQFIQKEYTDFFNKNFMVNIEQSPRAEEVRPALDKNLLQDLGFQKILLANGNSFSFPENNLWIMKENKLGNFIKNIEGNYEFEVNVLESREYELNLKYSSNFIVFINGKKSELIKNDNFSKLYLEKGKNNIKIYFYPFDIQSGLLLGLSMFVGFFSIIFILKKFNFLAKEI